MAAYNSIFVAWHSIPMAWAFAMSIIVLGVFRISEISIMTILSSSLISALAGIFSAMMVVSVAGNRVEGLALSKLMGIGLILVWFIPEPYSYFFAFLPSFWIGKLIMDGASVFSFLFGLLTCLIWIFFFARRFLRRIG